HDLWLSVSHGLLRMSPNKTNLTADTPVKSKGSVVSTKIVSDVDKDIPSVGNTNNENTFAVIIANGLYQKVAQVEHAENDGRTFEEYCNKTLGIPDTHIRSYYNVTYGDLLDAIEDIKAIATAKRGDLNIIFYYAGHGIPNEDTKTGYILPVDADGKQMRVCYPLKELYTELGELKASNTVVFLDACFSGAPRSSGEMLIPARGVAIVAKDDIQGKLVVFSAASGSQTALGYDEQEHGLFTYFLLKKLKDTKGSVDLGSLADYIQENVSLESQLKNRKQQTPTVMAGSAYGDAWKKLTLNK
ncbi:MAG: caspase family protein, partial [Bacteroidales bacterium]|nr:caspase family protein [Bacteroidales bacterium]